MILFSGPGSEQIGSEITEILGIEASVVEHRTFPDGESYVRLTMEVKGRDVVLVHSTAPPQDRCLVQLLLMFDALREGKPNSIVVVLTSSRLPSNYEDPPIRRHLLRHGEWESVPQA